MSEVHRPIIIRRKRHARPVHHGGSWKIALADFMTALMALFLVLWILATATPAQLQGVAEYFRTPLAVALTGGDRHTASTSAIPGGGDDPVHTEGERSRVSLRQENRNSDVLRQFVQLQARIESVVSADPALRDLLPQMRFDYTVEGLRIQLVDTDQRPMFALGSDDVAPYMRDLLHTLAPLLNALPNKVSLSGHTDSLRYAAGERAYSNWELSSDRANASRRELVAGGLAMERLVRISGMADRVPVPGSQAGDAVNRRISLIVLSPEAARRIQSQQQGVAPDDLSALGASL